MYDLTNMESFRKLSKWINDIRNESEDMLVFIVGNKSDKENRVIEREEAEAFAKENKAHYVETSAKTGDNVDTLFQKITELLSEATKGNGTGQGNASGSFQRKLGFVLLSCSCRCQFKSDCCRKSRQEKQVLLKFNTKFLLFVISFLSFFFTECFLRHFFFIMKINTNLC